MGKLPRYKIVKWNKKLPDNSGVGPPKDHKKESAPDIIMLPTHSRSP